MSDLTLISFVDPGGGDYGLAALSPERSDALLAGGETTISCHTDTPRSDADAVQLDDDGSTIALHWSSAGDSFRMGIEERAVGVLPVEVGAQATGPGGETSFDGVGIAWDLTGAGDVAAARTLWMALDSNRLLLLCALRPAGAEHHDAEQILAVQIGSDGDVVSYADPLLSTEYDESSAHTRATLELWTDQDGQPADRGGGLRTIGASLSAGGARIEAARFDWRLNGIAGIGAYEIVTV